MPLTARPNGKSILVVDDHPEIRRAVSMILSSEGYSVTAAGDVPSAAAALESANFAAIVTDLQMPGPPGVALVEEVERRGLRTPVILMSGSLEDLDPADKRIDRVAGLLPKPFSVETLRSLVRALTWARH